MVLSMYDLHNHLLPGIDDGPNRLEETLKIMEISQKIAILIVLMIYKISTQVIFIVRYYSATVE